MIRTVSGTLKKGGGFRVIAAGKSGAWSIKISGLGLVEVQGILRNKGIRQTLREHN